MDGNDLGEYLRRSRDELGLTLRDVERRTNGAISSGYLSQVENGKILSPSPSMLRTLAAAMDLPHSDLMTLAGHYAPATESEAADPTLAIVMRSVRPLTPDEREEVITFARFLRSKRNTEQP